VKYFTFKIAGPNIIKEKKIKAMSPTQAGFRDYIRVKVCINHSNYPDVAIKPRSKMPLMHSREIWLCRIGITCHTKVKIMHLQ